MYRQLPVEALNTKGARRADELASVDSQRFSRANGLDHSAVGAGKGAPAAAFSAIRRTTVREA